MRVIEILIWRLLREESCWGRWHVRSTKKCDMVVNSSMSAYNLIVLTALITLENHENKKMTWQLIVIKSLFILLKVKNSGLFISTIATLNFRWNCRIGTVRSFSQEFNFLNASGWPTDTNIICLQSRRLHFQDPTSRTLVFCDSATYRVGEPQSQERISRTLVLEDRKKCHQGSISTQF